MRPRPGLLLASTSPRRRALLDEAGIEHGLVTPGHEPRDVGGAPIWRALARARSKALGAEPIGSYDEVLVLGVDTVVAAADSGRDGPGDGDREYGKPTDAADAAVMLRALQGAEHRVHTGAVLVRFRDGRPAGEWSRIDSARVRMAALDDAALAAVVARGLWQGKAGGYGIQDGVPGVELLEGSFDAVVGLHVDGVRALLRQAAAASDDADRGGRG